MFEKITFKSIEEQLKEQGFKQEWKSGNPLMTLDEMIEIVRLRRKVCNNSDEDIRYMYIRLVEGKPYEDARYLLYIRAIKK